MLRTTGFAAPLLLVPVSAFAADSDTQLWTTLNASIQLDKALVATLDVSPRARSSAVGGDQLLTRASLEYTVARGVTIGAGVAWVESGGPTELRPHQQITLTSGPFSLRTRLEERIFDGADRTGLRLREKLQGRFALDHNDQLSVSTEILLALRATAANKPTGVEQLRFTLVETHRMASNLDLGLGFQLLVNPRKGRTDQISHVPMVIVNWRL